MIVKRYKFVAQALFRMLGSRKQQQESSSFM